MAFQAQGWSALRHDWPREIAEFHRRFYHQEPTAAQIDRLLAEPGVAPR